MSRPQWSITVGNQFFAGFWGMPKGFADGAWAMLRTRYHVTKDVYQLRKSAGGPSSPLDRVVDEWGPREIHLN